MPNYKKMYHILFNRITDIVDELQEVQRLTEEMYMTQEAQVIKLEVRGNEERDSENATP